MTERGHEPWVRTALRRRRRRRAGVVAVPVALLTWGLAARSSAGSPGLLAVSAVVVLAVLVVAGWWWLERQAGESPRRMLAAHRDGSAAAADLADELDDDRSDHVLRHGLPAPAGSRARVEDRARRRARTARQGLVVAPLYVALAAGSVLVPDDPDPWRLALAGSWLALSLVLLVRSVRDRRVAGRWLAEHGTAP